MSALVALAAAADLALVALFVWRLRRSWERGISLRFRIFCALAVAMLTGALATGLYATAVDVATLGFAVRFAHVAPRGFVLASALLPIAAAAAALVGRMLARPVETLTEAAEQIAEGQGASRLLPDRGSGSGEEARKLSRALASMRREIADKPYAAAFLRDAWHDLKTPVAAISATLEVLEDGALEDPVAARSFLANLRRSADQLDRRLADLVTLARFETSAIAAARDADLTEVVAHALELLTPLAEARHVRLGLRSFDGSPHVSRARCDESALGRALGNLIENAIQASPGGAVHVEVDDHARDVIRLDIVNEPSRIPTGMRERLFQRASSARGHTGGSGLGLAIARAAIEAHGGRVRFTELGPPRVAVRIELPR